MTVYDPTSLSGVGSVSEFLDAVNSLYAHGGGDCPEYGMSATLAALNKIDELNENAAHSHVIVLTDASAKDDYLYTSVISKANEIETTVHFFLSGYHGCGGSTGFGHYEDIATSTGGTVVRSITDFDTFATFIDLFTSSSSRKKRSIFGGEAPCHSVTVSIFAVALDVLIQTDVYQVIVTSPDGTEYLTNPGSLILFSRSNPTAGDWTFCVSSGTLAISFTLKTSIDFSVSYITMANSSEIIIPRVGLPPACE